MAVRSKNKTTAAANPAVRQEKKKLLRGIILLAMVCLFIAGCAAALFWLKSRMFKGNEHFLLRVVNIESSGYWGKGIDNRRILMDKLKLRPVRDNLFDLDPAKLKKVLLEVPNIADAEVYKTLPDTLNIRIEERIPRAFIGRPNSPQVVDANCVVMNSRECFGVHPRLPVINGMKHTYLKVGEQHRALQEALNLIMSVQRYPCFSVVMINLSQPDKLVVYMDYRVRSMVRRYHVTMPTGNYPEWLDTLKSAIENARRHGNDHTRINLTFQGQVVLSR